MLSDVGRRPDFASRIRLHSGACNQWSAYQRMLYRHYVTNIEVVCTLCSFFSDLLLTQFSPIRFVSLHLQICYLLCDESSPTLSRTSGCACYLEIEAGNELKLVFCLGISHVSTIRFSWIAFSFEGVHLNEMNRGIYVCISIFFFLDIFFYLQRQGMD